MTPPLSPPPAIGMLLEACAEVRRVIVDTADPRLRADLARAAAQVEQSAAMLAKTQEHAAQRLQARQDRAAQLAAANQAALARLRAEQKARQAKAAADACEEPPSAPLLPLDPDLMPRLRAELLHRFGPQQRAPQVRQPHHILDGWNELESPKLGSIGLP